VIAGLREALGLEPNVPGSLVAAALFVVYVLKRK
jgi:hypothetical protein